MVTNLQKERQEHAEKQVFELLADIHQVEAEYAAISLLATHWSLDEDEEDSDPLLFETDVTPETTSIMLSGLYADRDSLLKRLGGALKYFAESGGATLDLYLYGFSPELSSRYASKLVTWLNDDKECSICGSKRSVEKLNVHGSFYSCEDCNKSVDATDDEGEDYGSA